MKTLYPFFLARALGSLGNELLGFAVPLLVYKITKSLGWSGLAFFIEWVPRLLSFPLSGVWVDRFGPRRMYLFADALRFITGGFAIAFIVVFPSTAVFAVLIIGVIGGFSFELAFLSVEKVIQEKVPDQEMSKAQAILGSIDHTMMLLGPALAAVLVSFWSTTAVLCAMVFLFLCSFVLFLWTVPPSTHAPPSKVSMLDALLEGVRFVIGNHRLRAIVMLTTLVNALVGLSLTVAPAMVKSTYGSSDGWLGVLYTASGIAGLIAVSSTPLLASWWGLHRLGVTAFIASCIAFFVAGVAPCYLIYALSVSCLMAFGGSFTVFIRSERALLIPKNIFGRTVGVIILLNFLPMPLIGLITAAIGDYIGPVMLIKATAISCFLLSLPLLWPLWSKPANLTHS